MKQLSVRLIAAFSIALSTIVPCQSSDWRWGSVFPHLHADWAESQTLSPASATTSNPALSIAAKDLPRMIAAIKSEMDDLSDAMKKPFSLEVSRRYGQLFDLSHQLILRRNREPELFRQAGLDRVRERMDSLQHLSQEREFHDVNILVVSAQGGEGVMGRARLLAEGLISATPWIRVHIQEIDKQAVDFEDFHPRILDGLDESSRILIAVVGASFNQPVPTGVILHIAQPLSRQFRLNRINDLASPHGSIPLNDELRQRNELKNGWPLETLFQQRREWLSDRLSAQQHTSLATLANAEKWMLERSIWSWIYVYWSSAVIMEIENYLARSDLNTLPFREDGGQIIFHWVLPRGSRLPSSIEQSLTHLGVRVVHPDGRLSAGGDRRIPITVILHSAMPHRHLKTLQAELSGTSVKDPEGKFWIGFPVFGTGSASWLEGISSQSIILHDDWDGKGKKRLQLEACLIRLLSFAYPHWTWDALDWEAQKMGNHLILGAFRNANRYNDLLTWTREVREFSQFLFDRFNMVDVILADVVRISRTKPQKQIDSAA